MCFMAGLKPGSNAKQNWIQGSITRPGVFKKKAKAAGMTTRQFATANQNAPGLLGKEAREAKTLMKLSRRRRMIK